MCDRSERAKRNTVVGGNPRRCIRYWQQESCEREARREAGWGAVRPPPSRARPRHGARGCGRGHKERADRGKHSLASHAERGGRPCRHSIRPPHRTAKWNLRLGPHPAGGAHFVGVSTGNVHAAHCSSASPLVTPSRSGMPWNGCRHHQDSLITKSGAISKSGPTRRWPVFSRCRNGQARAVTRRQTAGSSWCHYRPRSAVAPLSRAHSAGPPRPTCRSRGAASSPTPRRCRRR